MDWYAKHAKMEKFAFLDQPGLWEHTLAYFLTKFVTKVKTPQSFIQRLKHGYLEKRHAAQGVPDILVVQVKRVGLERATGRSFKTAVPFSLKHIGVSILYRYRCITTPLIPEAQVDLSTVTATPTVMLVF